MIEWWEVLILSIVEGVTEFLPISSTGHLIVVGEALSIDETLLDTYVVVIQVGAVFAVLGFYWRDIFNQIRHIINDRGIQRFWLGILIAFIPAAVLGFIFGDVIDDILFSPTVVGVMLILGGIVFFVVERFYNPDELDLEEDVTRISIRQALIIGVAQTFALAPGVSRSGASIVGGMLAGMSRRAATQFSFYLAIPTLGGATVYVLLRDIEQIQAGALPALLAGVVLSFIVAWLSIAWLLRFVSNNSFVPFGVYRVIAGTVILILVAVGFFG